MIAILSLAISFTGCKKEEPVLTVDASNQTVTKEAGNFTINVTSNTDWSASSSETWCKLEPSSGSLDGSIKVTYEANTESEERETTITITAEGVNSATITVTQAGSEKAVPELSEGSINNAESVKKDKEPKSTKYQGSKDVGGKNVGSASSTSMTSAGQQKMNTLTGASKKSENFSCWYIDEVNGEYVDSDDFLFFFDEDGTYYVYDISEDLWEWGFYYVDEDLTMIAFDIDLDNPDFWLITDVSEQILELTDGEDLITLANLDLDGYDEEEYTQEEMETLMSDKAWFMSYVYVDNEYAGSPIDDGMISMIVFDAGGVFIMQDFELDDDGEMTLTDEIIGEWSIDSEGLLYLDFGDFQEYFAITYLLDDEFGMWTFDDDGTEYEWNFLETDAFIDEFFGTK